MRKLGNQSYEAMAGWSGDPPPLSQSHPTTLPKSLNMYLLGRHPEKKSIFSVFPAPKRGHLTRRYHIAANRDPFAESMAQHLLHLSLCPLTGMKMLVGSMGISAYPGPAQCVAVLIHGCTTHWWGETLKTGPMPSRSWAMGRTQPWPWTDDIYD